MSPIGRPPESIRPGATRGNHRKGGVATAGKPTAGDNNGANAARRLTDLLTEMKSENPSPVGRKPLTRRS